MKLRTLAVALALIAIYAFVGARDFEDQQIAEKMAKERPSPLSLPILYDATVTQVNAHGEVRTRFYSRSGK